MIFLPVEYEDSAVAKVLILDGEKIGFKKRFVRLVSDRAHRGNLGNSLCALWRMWRMETRFIHAEFAEHAEKIIEHTHPAKACYRRDP